LKRIAPALDGSSAQEMKRPSYAASYFRFGLIQFHYDIVVIQAFSQQSMDRAQGRPFIPKGCAFHTSPNWHRERESHRPGSLAKTGFHVSLENHHRVDHQ
jgi:hypothetical protein